MRTFDCVNIKHQDFVALQNKYDYETAAYLTRANNMYIPSLNQAEKMLIKERNKQFDSLLDYLNNSNFIDKIGITKYLKPYVSPKNGFVFVKHSDNKGVNSSFSPTIYNFNIANLKKIQNQLLEQGYNLFTIEPNKTIYGSKVVLNTQEINKINSEKSSVIDAKIEVYNEDLNKQILLFQTSQNYQGSLQEGLEWAKKTFPNLTPELQKGLIEGIARGSFNTLNDVIKLSEEFADKGTVKHEFGHLAFKYLPKEQKEALLNEGSKLFNIPRGESKTTVKYSKEQQNQINYAFRAIENIQKNINKVVNWYGNKNVDFWKKLNEDLQIPKDQIELLKQTYNNLLNKARLGIPSNKEFIEEMLADFAANYSYTVEINTAKDKVIEGGYISTLGSRVSSMESRYGKYYYTDERGVEIQINKTDWETAKQIFDEFQKGNNRGIATQYYSNLTVPGGTNYTENEISTPAITPSIKGHAQFSTDNGIAWFRSDDRHFSEGTINKNIYKVVHEEGLTYYLKNGKEITGAEYYQNAEKEIGSKTRRILEVQSDLFQKGRKMSSETLAYHPDKNNPDYDHTGVTYPNLNLDSKENQFLQLLNKDNNWVTFFVKSIIQDSAKKGYEKVLFPTGNTASKVEGHTTLEEFKKQKEDRIKELNSFIKANEEAKPDKKDPRYNEFIIIAIDNKINGFKNEINQLKQELERVETEGFGALKPIYNFYENTVYNILKKQGFNPIQITDEYGNTWNEVEIKPEFLENIKLQSPKVEYTGDLAIEEKIMEMLEKSPDKVVKTSVIGKFFEQLKQWLKNIFNKRTEIQKFIDDINLGKYKYLSKSNIAKLTKIQDENAYDKAKNEWKFSPKFDEQQQLNILNTLTGLTFQFVSKALLEGKAVNIFTKEIVNDQVQIVTKKVYQKKLEELNKKGELGLQDTKLKEKLESLLQPEIWSKFQQAILNNLKQFGFQINKSGEVVQIDLKDEDFEQFTPTEEDSDATNISETEATGKAKNFSDYGEYTISTKEKLSPRLKVWLSSIPSNEESYIPVNFPNLNVENTFVPIDIVINAINEATIGKRTPEAMIEAMEKEGNTVKNRYFLLDVAKRLKAEQKTDSRIPNEFFSKFNQTKNEMVMVKTSFSPRKINNQIVRNENNEIVFDINNQVININRGDIPNNLRELWWNYFFFNNSEEENNELTLPKSTYKNIYSNYLNVKESLFKYFDGYGNLITENSRNEVRLKLSNLFNSINVELNNEVLDKLIDGFNNYNKFKIGESSIFNEKFGILGQIFSEFKPDIANAEKAFGSTGILKLTQEQAKYVDNFMNTSAKDGKNRSIWAYGLNNPFTREMFEIFSSVKELQNQRQEIKEGKNIQENAYILDLLKNHYSGKSEILNLLATLPTESLETFLNNFKWSIFNVTKSSVKGAKGKELKHMTPREFINSQIQLFTNSTFTTKIQGVERKWSFKFLTTPSDKTTMFLLNTPDHTIELSSDLSSVKPNTVNLFYDKFLGEYNKIKAYLEGSEGYKKSIDDIATYEPKAFYHFSQFNVKSKFLWDNGKLRDLNEEVDGIKVSTYIKDKIKEQIEQDIAQTKKNWENEGLIENGKLLTGVNQNYREKLPRSVSNIGILETLSKQLETNPLLQEQYLKVLNESDRKITDYLVADFAINKHLFNIEASMLVLGDPTMFLKNSKQKISQEQFLNSPLSFWKEWGNNVRDNLSKRMAGLQGSGKEPNWQNETANTIVIQDPKTSSKIIEDLKKIDSKIASKFAEIDILDGQEFVTAEEDLHLKYAEGKITKSKYEELLKKVKGAAKELEEGKEISEKNQFSPEDIAIAQAQKPLVWGLINDSFLKIRKVTYNKPSAFGLYPQFTQGLEIDNLRQSIHNHNKNNKRVDRIVMLSAAKLGAKAPIQNVFNNDGSVSKFTISPNQIDEIPRYYLRIQLEVPYKKSEEIRMLTQSVKLMFNEVLDTIFDGDISGKDLKAKHDNLYKQTFQLNYDNFLIDAGAKLTPTGNYEFEDYTKLQETLLEHAITQGYDLNELEGLSLEEDKKSFKLPLAFSAKADKFEKLLLSLINDIILQKIHGRSFVLASEAGFKPTKKTEIVEGKEANDWINYNKTNIVWSSNFNPEKGLLPQRIDPNNPNKTLPAQVLVSFKFFDNNQKALNLNDFIYEKDGHKFINTKKISPELLKIIGIRVPTQGHASMADIEIVGFIPDFMGDLIVAPQDFTKQMGSDFDIDKLYSYMYNYQYKNGNLSRFTFDEVKIREARAKKEDKAIDNLILAISGDSAKEAFTESEEKFEKRINEQKIKVLQDQIQDIYHTVLSNKEVYLKMLEGITEGNLTELADQFKKSTFKEDTELPSLSSDRYKIEEYFDNAAGKLGVGIYSANSTFLALIEGKDLFLQKPQKVNYTNKKGEEKTKNVTKPYPFIIKDSKGNSFNLLNLSGAKGVNKLISMFQSASVDNAKLKVLSALSIDKNTMGITAIMAALADDSIVENGKPVYNEDYIIKFISQPIIKEYLAGLKTGSDDVKKNSNKSWKSDLLAQIKSKYVQELLDLQGEEVYKILSIPYTGYSEQDLDFGINQGILNQDLDKEKYLKMQLDIIEQFEYFEKVANLLRKAQYLTNTDAKGTPQTIQEALFKKQNKIDLLETAETENSPIVIGNIANIFDGITDYLFDLGIILPIQIYKGNNFNAPILPYGTFRYEQFIKDFKTLQNKAEQDDFYNAQEAANLYNSFLSFIWSFPSLKIADNTLSKERLNLIKDTETNKSLATEIEEFKQTIDYFNSPILKPLFNSLKSKPNKKDPSLKFIDFQVSVGLINPDTEVILSLEYLRNLNYPLFEKIIKYSFLVTPANSTTSLRKFIPNFYLEAIGISKELNKINKLLNTETSYINLAKKDSMPPVSPLIYQTLQHYPNYAQNIDNNFKGFNEDKSKLQIDLKINSDYILIYNRIANPYQFLSSYDSNIRKWRLYEFQSEEKQEDTVIANYQEIPTLGDYNLSEFDASYTSKSPKPSIIKSNNPVGIEYRQETPIQEVVDSNIEEQPINKEIKPKIDFQEEPTTGYRQRTINNAKADATIAIAVDFNSAGEKLTKSSVLNQGKKYIPIDANTLTVTKERVDKIVEQLNSVNAKTLNIAGNGIYTMKGKYTQQQVDNFTYDLLNQVINSPNLKTKIESIRSGGQTGFDEAGAKAGIRLGLPTIVLAPKGWTFRNINGQDISDEQQFKDRFKTQEQLIVKESKEEINDQIVNNPIGFNTGYLETIYGYNGNKLGKENVSNILNSVQKNSSNKAYKIIAQILLEISKKQNLLDGVNINLSNKNEYDSKTQTIYLDLSDKVSFPKAFEYNFLHELVHHITIGKMTDGSEISKILTRNIQNLINTLETEENLQKAIDLLGLKTTPQELKNKLSQLRQEQSTSQEESLTTFSSEEERSILNPLINPFEFVSSILNDENTQKWMNEINYPQSELSIFGKFVDYIKGLFNNLIRTLGFKPNKTVLNEGLNNVLQILTKEDAEKQGNQLDLFGTFKLTKVEKEAQTEVKKLAIQQLEDRKNLLWNEYNKIDINKSLTIEEKKSKKEPILKRINTINRNIDKLKNEFDIAFFEEEGFKAIEFVKSVLSKSEPPISEIMESIAILHTQKDLAKKIAFELKEVSIELKQVIENLYGASEGYLQKLLSISADSIIAKYNDITGRGITKEEFLKITKNTGAKNEFLGGEDVHNPLTQFVATLVFEMGIKTQNEINQAKINNKQQLDKYTEKYDFRNLLEIREEYDPITNITKKIKNFKTRVNSKYYQTLKNIFSNASEISGKNKPAYIQARMNEVKFIIDLRYLFPEEFNKDTGTKTLSNEDTSKYLQKLKEFFIKEYSEYPQEYAEYRMNEVIEQAKKRFEPYIELRNQQFELIREEFPEDLAQQTVLENNWLAYNSPFLLLNERYSLSTDNMSLKIQTPYSKLSAKVTENGETKFVPWTKVDEITGETVKIRVADKYFTDKPRRKDFNGNITGFINDEYTNWELEFFQKAVPAIEKNEVVPPTMLGFLKLIQQMQHEYLKLMPYYLTKDVGYYNMLDVPADFKEMMEEAQVFQKFILAGELVWDEVVKTASIPFIEEQSKKIDLITGQIQKEFNPRFQNDSFNQKGLGELKTNDVYRYFDFITEATLTYKNKIEAEHQFKIAQFLYSQGALINSKGEVYNKDKELFDWIIDNKFYNIQKDTRIQREENFFNPVSKSKIKLTKAEKEKIKVFEKQLSDILEKYPNIEDASEEVQKEYNKIQSQIDKIQRQRTSGTTYDVFEGFQRFKYLGWSSLGRVFDTIATAFIGNEYEALDGRIFNQTSLLKSLGVVNASYGVGYVGSLASTSAITTGGVVLAGSVTGLLPAAALSGTVGTLATVGASGLIGQKVIDQTELKQKVSQLLYWTGALEHFDYLSKDDERAILSGTLSELSPYSLLEKADVYNKATTVIAAIYSYKIKDKTGKNRPLWDAFTIENNTLVWNNKEFNPQNFYNLDFTGDNSKEWVNFRKKIERVLKNVHGDMASGFTTSLSRKNTGKRVLLFLKTYMTQILNRYFSGQTYDPLTNTYYTGRIAGSFNVISNLVKKENQTQEDISAAKQMLFNLSVWASLAIAAKFVETSIKEKLGGDDDDDFLWVLLNFINRTSADVASVLDIDSNRIKQTSTILPQLRWIFDFLSFNKAIIKSFIEGDTMTRQEMSANKLIPKNEVIDQETREEYNEEKDIYEDITYYKIYDPTIDQESNWLKNPPKYNKEFEPTSRVFYKGMKIAPFTNSYKQLENLRKTNNLYK